MAGFKDQIGQSRRWATASCSLSGVKRSRKRETRIRDTRLNARGNENKRERRQLAGRRRRIMAIPARRANQCVSGHQQARTRDITSSVRSRREQTNEKLAESVKKRIRHLPANTSKGDWTMTCRENERDSYPVSLDSRTGGRQDNGSAPAAP